MGRWRRVSKTLPLSRGQATSIWCRETQERVIGAGQLLQPLNRDRWRSLLGSSELARCCYGCRRQQYWWVVVGGLTAAAGWWLWYHVVYGESVLGFDNSTLTHKILFIYKVHDITVLPLLLITEMTFFWSWLKFLLKLSQWSGVDAHQPTLGASSQRFSLSFFAR